MKRRTEGRPTNLPGGRGRGATGLMTLSPCRSRGGIPKLDKRPAAPDGWTRIGCWNDDCDYQPTTGWFRDDANDGIQATATWERMCGGRNEEAAKRDERKGQ